MVCQVRFFGGGNGEICNADSAALQLPLRESLHEVRYSMRCCLLRIVIVAGMGH